MGMYGPDGQVTLWVAGAPANLMAAKLVEAMHDKIALGRSPFTPVGERREGGRTIYELDGMGQKHSYFQSGTLVIWLAAEPEVGQQALKEALEFYP